MAGAALNTLGRTDEAVPLHEEGLELARQLGDPGLVLRRLNSIAEARRAAGQLDEAERHYREALELSRTRSDRLGVVVVLLYGKVGRANFPTLLGGAGTFFGPFVGAATFLVLEDRLSVFTESWPLFIGLIFMAFVLFLPKGIWGTLLARLR